MRIMFPMKSAVASAAAAAPPSDFTITDITTDR
ncbi:MAG: hypothetical protein QOF87_203 [Pseudonocardiales bacterium]|nr:hypothetical protein [Pseudonocardiales bacterium]MDT4960556.1 hypothetical protein [Pseudonocardiales bacterium]